MPWKICRADSDLLPGNASRSDPHRHYDIPVFEVGVAVLLGSAKIASREHSTRRVTGVRRLAERVVHGHLRLEIDWLAVEDVGLVKPLADCLERFIDQPGMSRDDT